MNSILSFCSTTRNNHDEKEGNPSSERDKSAPVSLLETLNCYWCSTRSKDAANTKSDGSSSVPSWAPHFQWLSKNPENSSSSPKNDDNNGARDDLVSHRSADPPMKVRFQENNDQDDRFDSPFGDHQPVPTPGLVSRQDWNIALDSNAKGETPLVLVGKRGTTSNTVNVNMEMDWPPVLASVEGAFGKGMTFKYNSGARMVTVETERDYSAFISHLKREYGNDEPKYTVAVDIVTRPVVSWDQNR